MLYSVQGKTRRKEREKGREKETQMEDDVKKTGKVEKK